MRAFSLFPRRPGESACGHALRHAALQGWRSVPAFARGIGVGWSRLLSGEDVEIAAAAFGESIQAVAFDSGSSSPSSVRLRGAVLSRRQWSGTAPIRFCPSCLADDAGSSRSTRPAAWLRTWWDVLAVAVCPVHLAPLATACGCGAPVARQAPFSGRCPSCSASLADTPSQASIERASLAGQLYVLGRIGASARVECAVLDRSPLKDAIDAMDAVGRASGPGGCGHLPMDIGFEAFAGWPRGFGVALDGIAADRQVRAGRWGAAKAYGPLHGFASDAGKGTLASRMAKRMAAHANRNGISPGRTLYGLKCGGGDVASLAEVSRRTGLSYARSRRLLLPAVGASGGSGAPAAIDGRTVAELERLVEGSVDLKGMAAILGIGRKAVRALVGAGTLTPVVSGADGTRHVFRPEDATRLAAAVVAALEPFDGEVKALPDACRDMQVPIAKATGLVLRGGVRGRALRDGGGLRRIAIAPADLRVARREKPMTLADAALALGVKWEVARDLRAAGLIGSKVVGQVSAASVATFAETHVAASVAATALRTSPRALLARAKERGVVPAIERPACRQAFFVRSDLERLHRETTP